LQVLLHISVLWVGSSVWQRHSYGITYISTHWIVNVSRPPRISQNFSCDCHWAIQKHWQPIPPPTCIHSLLYRSFQRQSNIIPCKGIQASRGFRIPNRGFWIRTFGFRIPKFFNSGFHSYFKGQYSSYCIWSRHSKQESSFALQKIKIYCNL